MGSLLDAAADPRFIRHLVSSLAAERDVPIGENTALRFHAKPALTERIAEISDATVESPGDIGTNTTVRLGDWGFLKLYRYLREGVSPEVEMAEFFAEQGGFDHVVPLLGSVELLVDGASEGIPIALLQDLVFHQGSAWDIVVGHQRRILEHEEDRTYLDYLLDLLGKRTAQMHGALLKSSGKPAFDPEPVTQENVQQWVRAVTREAQETLDLLQSQFSSLTGYDRDVAQRLLSARADIVQMVSEWRVDVSRSLCKSRYHGDFHLGQVLLVEEDFVIIDFEGEPARSFEERRRKHSIVRDVAGMLRSFDYAAFQAARATLEPGSRSPLDLTLMTGQLRDAACDAYLTGYRDAGAVEWDAASDRLLRLFLWEKALYEVRYELRSRPEWVGIPLIGLERYFLR
jgi:maltose alpha-D-glucosyltransferase/alpha-amylase